MSFILTSGKSMVAKILDNSIELTTVKTNLTYSTFGEAMAAAIKVNNLLGTSSFKVISIL